MSKFAERLRERYFGDQPHPYQIFEAEVGRLLKPHHTLVDAGCGRTAPVLATYRGRARRLVGIDVVDFTETVPGIELVNADFAATGLPDASVDLIMSRSVLEHVVDPLAFHREVSRILKPGGHFVFLTANFWDYASLIAHVLPNRWHPWIVSRTEGREEADVFPTAYRVNTRRAIARVSSDAGLQISGFRYLGQYPNYLMFNGALFLVGTAYQKTLERVPGLQFLQGWILATLQKPVPEPR